MKRVHISGTELEVSSLCLGMMQFGAEVTGDDMDALMDIFRDAGGNFFDTAHCYSFWQDCGDGASERILGDYVKRHGCRDEVVIATKGGHPAVPGYRRNDEYLTAGRVGADIDDSLARLQVDEIDLYWLHRDDPRVPVAEVLGILEAEVKRGRIRTYGGSNWTAPRLAEANAVADDQGAQGFCASQPQWHLASPDEEPEGEKRMEPGVGLTLSIDDADWHEQSQMPVMPYAPTARGFFATDGASAEHLQNETTLARLQRTKDLADELKVTPNQVALAWLCHHPFPVIPILGTSNADHLRDALGADAVSLTPEQVRWLKQG